MSKFTREDLKNWFRDTHPDAQPTQPTDKDGLLTESYGDMNDPYNSDANPDLVMADKPYTSSGTFSSAGSEARHAARRKEESQAPGRTIYALISIPYEGSIVLSEDSMEELRKEVDNYTSSGHASLEAIFYADIIEGEL